MTLLLYLAQLVSSKIKLLMFNINIFKILKPERKTCTSLKYFRSKINCVDSQHMITRGRERDQWLVKLVHKVRHLLPPIILKK